MGEFSKIEWTDHTFNPWIGCQKVSAGCDHCYAEAMMDHRYGKVQWGPHGVRKRTSASYWKQPLRWAKDARLMGVRPRVFCASLADVFDNAVPAIWRGDLWNLIRATPELDWLLLTKRPENIRKTLPYPAWPNIWLGVTAEDQTAADHRIPILLNEPAAVRFVSYEPALGPVWFDLEGGDRDLHWIICGGESGPKARPMDLAWARAARDQCAASGIAFFMKQIDKKTAIPADLMVRQFPGGAT